MLRSLGSKETEGVVGIGFCILGGVDGTGGGVGTIFFVMPSCVNGFVSVLVETLELSWEHPLKVNVKIAKPPAMITFFIIDKIYKLPG
jgi:hypothetical protein